MAYPILPAAETAIGAAAAAAVINVVTRITKGKGKSMSNDSVRASAIR